MYNTLTLGPVMLDIEGTTLTGLERDKIQHPNTGAVILFARNYADPEQVTELIRQIRSARNADLLIAVDQEGGRVQRFQEGFTRLPAAACYAKAQHAETIAATAGWLMASELLAVGVDFSFAPVLDVDCGISTIIGNRAFAQDPEQATAIASSFRQGMNQAGMAAVGKHFPGHGAIAADSHLALPIDERELEEIFARDITPFKALIEQGLEGIMPAHVVYSKSDSLPAGFSEFWVQQILRQQLNFKGAIFSDDLSMQGAAIAGDFVQRAEMALSAGCDMVLVCNNATAAEQVLETLPVRHDNNRQQRLSAMLGKPGMQRSELMHSARWQEAAAQINALNDQI